MGGRDVAETDRANSGSRKPRLCPVVDYTEAKELYYRTRTYLETEAGLISSRTNWIFASNAFLFTAYAVVSDKNASEAWNPAGHLRAIVPILGITICLGSVALIAAAIAVSLRLQHDLKVAIQHGSQTPAAESESEEVPSTTTARPPEGIGKEWPTVGGVLPDIRGVRWANLIGLFVPVVLGVALGGIWLWLALVSN